MQIAPLLRGASGDFLDAAVHLGRLDIVGGAATARQELEDAVVATESWRSEPYSVKIGSFQSLRSLQRAPRLLSESGLKEETIERLAALLIGAESSPQTMPISQSAEALIVQAKEQGASDETLVILRKAFAKLAAIRAAGFRF